VRRPPNSGRQIVVLAWGRRSFRCELVLAMIGPLGPGGVTSWPAGRPVKSGASVTITAYWRRPICHHPPSARSCSVNSGSASSSHGSAGGTEFMLTTPTTSSGY
jgi:hypothetical protein